MATLLSRCLRRSVADAVICQFGVMFFPDKDKSYREVRRVLAPGGRYMFSVWDAHRYNPFGRIAHEVIGSFFPGDPPKFYEVPFSYYLIEPRIERRFNRLGHALASAGATPKAVMTTS